MKILITNDDGIHAGGIIELAKKLREKHQVFMVAPRTEQSGISQAITFLRPLFPVMLGSAAEYEDDDIRGYSVDGTPTDCVKLGIFKLCPWKPDLVVSGINGGLNAGTNVCYSGTVGGALAGATFGFKSMAISLEYADQMFYARAAEITLPLIERFANADIAPRTVININIPTVALAGNADVRVVPVEQNPLGYYFDEGEDPKGRPYYWSNNLPDPDPSDFATDCQVLKEGAISVSPINFDLNAPSCMDVLEAIV